MERPTFALFTKVLKLNASATRDLDGVDTLPFNFDWTCKDDSGGSCVSQAGTELDMASFAAGELLILPEDTLPIGEKEADLQKYCPTHTTFGLRTR